MDVIGRRVDKFHDCKNAGDFFFTSPNPHEGDCRRLSFLCPCGCDMLAGIKVRDDGQQINGAWAWNGDMEKPTTTPSINIMNNHWHGYLTDGIFRSV